MSPVAVWLLVALSLCVAAWCSLAADAFERVRPTRAHRLGEERRSRGAEALIRIVESPAPYLNALLLIRVVAQVGGTALATGWAIARFGPGGMAAATGGMALLVFVLAEIVPRSVAVQSAERNALIAARPAVVAGILLTPVTKLLIMLANAVMALLPGRALPQGPFASEDELREVIGAGVEEEERKSDGERELIHSVFEFGDTIVREVMVPRTDMVAMPKNSTLAEALDTIVRVGYSRIPIYDGDTDNIVGVLYAKDLLRRTTEVDHDHDVASLARRPLFVPEQKKVAELLRAMQEERIHMAIVVDEYGGTAGLATIEDLIEEIVGEIVDEYDQEEPLVEPLDERTIRVDAKMLIDEVNELLDVDLPHEEWDTVGGLVFGLTGRVPSPGEIVRFDSLEFRTERVTGRRIQKVVITKPLVASESE